MEAIDFQLDNDGDLLIQNGDFVLGSSDEQHIIDIINSMPGDWKEHPLLGVGLITYLNGSGNTQALERNIKTQLQADGYSVNNPDASFDKSGNLVIKPNAIRI